MTDPVILCAHCGLPARGYASLAGGTRVCHDDREPDCYRLVTVYGEPLGRLKETA